MGDIAATLPTYYGLSNRARKERGNYICKTGFGYGKIFRTNESAAAIYQRYDMLEHLASAGFDQTDRIFLSKQNTPYINLGRETYVMTRYITGQELDFDNIDHVTLALKSLANFHKHARELKLDHPPAQAPPLFDAWKKQETQLEQALKQANRASRLSDFDVLVIKNASYYAELAAAAGKALKQTDYTKLQDQAIKKGCICHNTMKEENFPIMDGVCYITRITEPSLDLQLTDLANFIRRYARRSTREISITEHIKIYNSINTLPPTAEDIIRAQLIYPWQFIKVVKQYYNKKRGWTPIALMSRMKSVLEEQVTFAEYIAF